MNNLEYFVDTFPVLDDDTITKIVMALFCGKEI